MKKRFTGLSLAIILSLSLSACNSKPADKGASEELDKNKDEVIEEELNESSEGVNIESVKIGELEVYDIFTEKYPDTKLNEIGMELENMKYVYEIEGYTVDKEYEVKIDSTNGEILRENIDSFENTSGDIKKEDVEKVEKFVDMALKDGGSEYRLKEWKIKHELGNKLIEIEIFDSKNKDIEYKYNLETEELLEKDM